MLENLPIGGTFQSGSSVGDCRMSISQVDGLASGKAYAVGQ